MKAKSILVVESERADIESGSTMFQVHSFSIDTRWRCRVRLAMRLVFRPRRYHPVIAVKMEWNRTPHSNRLGEFDV